MYNYFLNKGLVRCDALTGRKIACCYLWAMPTAVCALTGRAATRCNVGVVSEIITVKLQKRLKSMQGPRLHENLLTPQSDGEVLPKQGSRRVLLGAPILLRIARYLAV